MKLRNKKTGEILEYARSAMVLKDKFRIYDEFTDKYYSYNSLAELNSEWEDYEESKDYWYLNGFGDVIRAVYKSDDFTRSLVVVGNYFETLEEAEKAVEKLKAWKRLKDRCGIRFSGINRNGIGRPVSVNLEFHRGGRTTLDEAKQNTNDLILLFGGEL